MKYTFVVALVFLLLPLQGTAQQSPLFPNPLQPGVDWLSQITDQVDQLITNSGDQLVQLGNIELAWFALLTLIGTVARWQLRHLVIGFHPVNYTMGDLLAFFFNLLACSLLLHYYNNPLPGTALSIHQIFPALAKLVTGIFDQTLFDHFFQEVFKAAMDTHAPNAFNVFGSILYTIVLVVISIMSFVMFAVNAFGFVALGMFVLFGPLMIPLFITRHFKNKFWAWVDGLLVFSMFRAVSAALSFVFVNVLIGFFDHSVAGDYTLGHWLALLPALVLLTGGFVYAMFNVPRITGMIFGGVAGQAQAAVDSFTSTVMTVASKLL